MLNILKVATKKVAAAKKLEDIFNEILAHTRRRPLADSPPTVARRNGTSVTLRR